MNGGLELAIQGTSFPSHQNEQLLPQRSLNGDDEAIVHFCDFYDCTAATGAGSQMNGCCNACSGVILSVGSNESIEWTKSMKRA